MPKTATDVLADALLREADARAEVCHRTAGKPERPRRSGRRIAWDADIKRRVDAIEAGAVRLEPWAEVKRRIERDGLRR